MKEPKYFSWIFFGLAALLFMALMFTAFKVGCVSDEWIDAAHGKFSLEYYLHKDTTFANYNNAKDLIEPIPVTQKYYGVGFEILPAIYVKIAQSDKNEFLIRHILCAFFGFLFMLFTALIAKALKNWRVAIVALIIMVFTPLIFGLASLASKDIPPAAGFAMAIFAFIRLFQRLPKISAMDVVLAVTGIALSISVRINGFLLILYFSLFLLMAVLMQKDIRTYYFHKPYKPLIPLVFIFLLIVFAGAALGLAFYPNIFHVGVTEHLKASFEVMKKFPVKITMLYKGKLINSLELPQGYKINAYLQTIPFFAWTGVCLFFAMSVKIFKRYSKIALSLLLFALIFPVLYIFFTDANVYNGWRHTMFIYSSFAVLSAIGFYELYELMSHKKWHLYWKTGVLIFFLISIFFPAKFIFKNYKYAYCFYNGLVSNPYQEYDQDYFETSGIVAFEWLHKHELNETDSVIISTKNTNLIHYQKNKQYPNIKIIKSGTLSFAEVDCDYSIITMQFLPKKVIKKIFPPKGTLHVETIDGNPICAVVKRNKLDINGIKAIQEDRFQDGIDLLEQAYDYDSNNFGIWYYMGVGYFHTGKYENTVEYFKKYLEFWATNTQQVEYAQYHTGLAYLNLKQYRKAISIMLPIYNNVQLVENKPAVGVNLGLAYFYLEEYPQAIFYLSQYIAYYPHLKEFLYYAYLETGDHANAQKLFTQK